jgi:hypothetical protein
MAHFAKISEDNRVLTVNAVNDSNALTEEAGQTYLEICHGWPAHLWKQTSYNTMNNQHKLGGTPFRGNYAAIGHTWDAENEIFWPQQPFPSWTKDISNAKWISPLGEPPALTAEEEAQNEAITHSWHYVWDESAYQADNTTGWVLTNRNA